MKPIRLFTAIEIPPDIKKTVLEVQHHIGLLDKKRILILANEKNMHITLEFLGNQPEDVIPHITECLKDICEVHPHFNLSIDKLDAFPTIKQPKVLWLGSNETNNQIIALDNELRSRFGELNIKADKKPLIPHLTIARSKRNIYPRLIHSLGKKLKEYSLSENLSIKVKKIYLFKSVISNQGAVHTKLATVPLKK